MFGAHHKSKEVQGTVVSVQVKQTNRRSVTYIKADWALPDRVKRALAFIGSVKASRSPAPETQTPVADEPDGPMPNGASSATPTQTQPAVPNASRTLVTNERTLSNESPRTHQPTTSAHGRDWVKAEVSSPLNGAVRKRPWSVRGPANQYVTEGYAPAGM